MNEHPLVFMRNCVCAALLVFPALLAAGTDARPPATPPANTEVAAATNSVKRVHAFVSGIVQGVGFRNFTTMRATELKLTGWVKNLADGRVEFVAEGPAVDIEKLMESVAKGPAGARVDKVERNEERPTGQGKRFETIR
jgi:acylphosphatase